MPPLIQGPAGRLEVALTGDTAHATRCLVICHPHPRFGGSLHNNVVHAIAAAGAAAGCAVATFNFRGVGRSEGRHDGGSGEVEDLRAVLQHLAEAHGCPENRVVLAGYSFGAAVAAQGVPARMRPAGLLLVSPPLTVHPIPAATLRWGAPKGLVTGASDEYCPEAEAKRVWSDAAPPAMLHVVPGADHFYFGRESAVEDATRSFLANLDGSDA